MTDEDLIAQVCQGESFALDELYRRYAQQLYIFCYHTLRQNPQQAEDMVHDTFERIINAAHTFNPRKASFRTWMFRIARNHCIDVMRRGAKIDFVSMEAERNMTGDKGYSLRHTLAAQHANVQTTVEQSEVAEAIRACIHALDNANERQALLLYYLGDKVYREIATILGKSLSMARNYIKAAREKMKACLEEKGIGSRG